MRTDREPTLHVVGDSISLHYGPALEVMLTGIATYSRKPMQGSDPETANGRDSEAVLAYLHSLSPTQCRAIDYLVVNCGLHDVKRDAQTDAYQIPPERYAANLATLVHFAAERGPRLIWVRTTPVVDTIHNREPERTFHRFSTDVAYYNQIADRIMSDAGVPRIDLHRFTETFGPGAYCDHVHYHDPVCRNQAAFIAGALSQIIASRQGATMSNIPIADTFYDQLRVTTYPTNEALGAAAAAEAANVIRAAVAARGVANIILATGNSQLTFLAALRSLPYVPWEAVNVFHMDEYVNLPPGHSASFPAFLRRHLLDYVRARAFFPVPGGAADSVAACREYEALLRAHPADLCACGIGENGHLAFNDPPYADFVDPVWVKVVALDERSRRQQVGEGHFGGLDEVPTHAITVTIPGLLAAKRVLVIVPEARKAAAVDASLFGPITEDCPGSILRRTPHAHLFLDRESAAGLKLDPLRKPPA